MGFQLPVFPCSQISQFDAGFSGAVQFRDFIADAFHHLTDLPVPAFMNDHLQFGVFFILIPMQQLDSARRRHSAIYHDTCFQFLDLFFTDQSIYDDLICLIDLITGMDDFLHQFSVIRQQQQS